MEQVTSILQDAIRAIEQAQNFDALNELRVLYLGKSGVLTAQLKSIGQLPESERPKAGAEINKTKKIIEDLLEKRFEEFSQISLKKKLNANTLDVTLPGRVNFSGSHHPVNISMGRLKAHFKHMGFVVADGPEIENEFYNFEALNIPANHPARAMQDTFYCENHLLLRTHTSPVQIRYMQQMKPPIRMVAPGRVYRCDSDVTHTPMFHQIEGLVVDEKTSFADLKGMLKNLMEFFFEKPLELRFRPSYFPFTEPSAEVDIACVNCEAKGCRVCKNSGWLEVLGCGMVHPNVLENVGYDTERYQGYAFGMGIDRLTMLRYKIDDLRILFENDVRFLKQF